MNAKKRICVIGAGTAGLCALKYALEHDLQATAYEKSSEIGGTWVYTEHLDNVSHEDDVHSSMYAGLRTNLPKEVMGFSDFEFSESVEKSFITAPEVLQFIQAYAKHFKLESYIKLRHEIVRVRPRKDLWEILIRDHELDHYFIEYYEFVFVCTGHYTTPNYPSIEGMQNYKGKQLHSHLYRKPDMFKDQKVLIIGLGPSGMDIAAHIYATAKVVYLSHHAETAPNTSYMTNVIHKPDVEHFTEMGATFKDGSSEDFTHVIYCTGYKYTFPFLSVDCGIHVDSNFVAPLYKHCININHTSMAFIGIPFNVLPSQVFDLQIRFALKYFTKQKHLPSREEMLADLEQDVAARKARGLPKKRFHHLGIIQYDYYKELASLAEITNIKPVVQHIMRDNGAKYLEELNTYRNFCYKCIDDEKFIKYKK